MSTSPLEELRFYLRNLTRFWLGPKLDLPRIPGPPGWRVVGNAPALAGRRDVHRVVFEWVERYGGGRGGGKGAGAGGSCVGGKKKGGSGSGKKKSKGDDADDSSNSGGNGIIKFWLFGQPIVVVSDPQVAAEVLARPGGGWRGPLLAAAGAHGGGGGPSGSGPSSRTPAAADPAVPTALPRKSIGYSFFDLCSSPLDGLRSFFSTSDEAHWASVRKAAAPAFSAANVKRRYFPVVLRHATALAEHVRDAAAVASSSSPSLGLSSSSSSASAAAAAAAAAAASSSSAALSSPSSAPRPIELQENVEIAMLDVALEALFGVDLRRVNSEEVACAMALALEEAQERVKFPLRGAMGALLWPRHAARVRAAQRTLAQLYGRIHDSVRDRGVPPADETALWAGLARLRDPSDPEGRRLLPRARFMAETGAMMMAGFDTSSHTAGWVLLALASHPDAQRRVKGELGSAGLLHVASGGVNCLGPRQLVYDDLEPQRLPYLCAVVAESMRLWPVGATGSVRETTARATRVGPYLLPPGVVVWPMIYALHMSSRNWGGGDPRAFRPERWLDASSGEFVGAAVAQEQQPQQQQQPQQPQPQQQQEAAPPAGAAGAAAATAAGGGRRPATIPKRFLPFSDGSKACLGQLLGLTEVKTVVAVLCSRFWFELPPPARGEAAAAAGGAREQVALTLKIRGGLRLVCRPHGGL